MSRELTEFSALIEEQFEPVEMEPDNFWELLINLFI